MNTTNRINQLAGLATEAVDEPRPDTLRQLADASLCYGLANSTRLPLIALCVIERIREVEPGVLVELQSVIEHEQRKRHQRARRLTACESEGVACG